VPVDTGAAQQLREAGGSLDILGATSWCQEQTPSLSWVGQRRRTFLHRQDHYKDIQAPFESAAIGIRFNPELPAGPAEIPTGRNANAGTIVVSQDGKTLTVATTGTNASGQPTNNIAVYDKP
jgi:hypothetical protein